MEVSTYCPFKMEWGEYKNWGGDLDLDFGSRPSTGANDKLNISVPLRLRNIVIRPDRSRLNVEIANTVSYSRIFPLS